MRQILIWIAIGLSALALVVLYRVMRDDPGEAPGIIFERQDRPSYS